MVAEDADGDDLETPGCGCCWCLGALGKLALVVGSASGEPGGADEADDDADDDDDDEEEADDEADELLADVLVEEETFLAVSAALLRTIRLMDETEGMLSSSQIPSDCNWLRISQANMVGFAFL